MPAAARAAGQAQHAAPAPSTFSAERLARIDAVLQQYVDENRLAGAVALVLRDGQTAYEKAVGWSDKEAGRRMAPTTIFRIASQTKAITSAAVLVLLEEGKLTLNDPVSRYIPSFANSKVAIRNDAAAPGTAPEIVPARRPITIRDLLTHTAGISYGTDRHVAPMYEAKGLGPAAGFGWYTADKSEPVCDTMERLGTLPFVAQPGEAWVYGYNTDILGCIVEKASGSPLDAFVQDADHGPARDEGHAVLPAGRAAGSPRRGLHHRRRWQDRARAGWSARAGELRRGSA